MADSKYKHGGAKWSSWNHESWGDGWGEGWDNWQSQPDEETTPAKQRGRTGWMKPREAASENVDEGPSPQLEAPGLGRSGGKPQTLGSGEGQLRDSCEVPIKPNCLPPAPPPPPPPRNPPPDGEGQLGESLENLRERGHAHAATDAISSSDSLAPQVLVAVAASADKSAVYSEVSSVGGHSGGYLDVLPRRDDPSSERQQAGSLANSSKAGHSQAARDASASNDSPPTLALVVAVAASADKPAAVLPVSFFLGAKVNAPHRQHNSALKYLRTIGEYLRASGEDKGPWERFSDVFEHLPDVMEVCKIKHGKGENYEVDWYAPKEQWSWLDMVKQLLDDDIKMVVNGPDDASAGLTHCSFSERPNSYCHKEHNRLTKAGVKPASQTLRRIWDFVLHREDGTSIRLHPDWKGTKVGTFDGCGHMEPVPLPKAGPGGTDGRGTFKYYKQGSNKHTLRFDMSKFDAASS